jgi:hypothetical protein
MGRGPGQCPLWSTLVDRAERCDVVGADLKGDQFARVACAFGFVGSFEPVYKGDSVLDRRWKGLRWARRRS